MGTKGKKNTPITARINSGLFNQKKGITEPLLGVGPAGVYGDNQTKDIPSPSKKRGYAKRSPLKQVGVNVVKSESTGDQIVKGKKITKNKSWDDLRAEGMSEEKITEAKAWRKKNPNAARDQVDTGTFEPDTVGPDKETEVNTNTDLYRKSTGKAQSAYDRRNNFRANTRANRGVNKNERKLGKYGSFNAAGDFTQKDNLSQRELRKMRGAQSKLKFAKQEVKNTNNQSKQNVGGFSKANVRNDDQRATMGDFDLKTEQPGMSTLSGKSNAFSKVDTSPNTEIGFTPAEQKLSKGGGLFKKAGPLKKGYFK